MKDYEFKDYVNNFYDINDENYDLKLNEVERKQIDIFFDSIEII